VNDELHAKAKAEHLACTLTEGCLLTAYHQGGCRRLSESELEEGRRLLEASGLDCRWSLAESGFEILVDYDNADEEGASILCDRYLVRADADLIVWLRNHADALLSPYSPREREA
jgi:hypothetical protein